MNIKIERLGHLGDGVAAGPVYAARTLPGELIEGKVEDGRISKPKIIEPSVSRRKAPCTHYNSCGGCSLLHATDDFVADWKRDVVVSALAAKGVTAEIEALETSPEATRRRAVFSGRRLKSGSRVGFHARGSDQVSDVNNCIVVAPEILAKLDALRDLTTLAATRKSEVSLAVTSSESGLDVDVSTERELDRDSLLKATDLAEKHDLARLSWQSEVIVTRRPPFEQFGVAHVVPPPGAFLQATKHGEAALVAAVQDAVGAAARIVDLFAGCGTFSLPLARHAEVLAVEHDQGMLDALHAGWRKAQELKSVRVESRDLFRRPLLAEELNAFDAIVLDPPRAGAGNQMSKVAESDVGAVASVSCNPVTFARDAALLVGAGFALNWVRVIDQFRWSPHVEIAAKFTR